MGGQVPGVSTRVLCRGRPQGTTQALRPPSSSATIWAAAIRGLAAVDDGTGSVGVAGSVGLGTGVRVAG